MKGKKPKYSLNNIAGILKASYEVLSKNDPLRMAGATAFFTTFALPAILVIMIQLLKLIFDPRNIRHQLFDDLSKIIGPESMHQVTQTLLGFRRLAQNWYITMGGFLFLVFVATTMFMIIKRSINELWSIRIVRKESFSTKLKSRYKSFIIILVTGILFAGDLFIEGIQAFLGKYIFELSPILALYFNSTVNYILMLLIVTIWFAILFRYLPDGRPAWKVVFAGALVTSILFNLGRFILHILLTYNNLNNLYGTSASIVLLLLFVFYTSLILYFGAAFTSVWAEFIDEPISARSDAAHYHLMETKHKIPDTKRHN